MAESLGMVKSATIPLCGLTSEEVVVLFLTKEDATLSHSCLSTNTVVLNMHS